MFCGVRYRAVPGEALLMRGLQHSASNCVTRTWYRGVAVTGRVLSVTAGRGFTSMGRNLRSASGALTSHEREANADTREVLSCRGEFIEVPDALSAMRRE